MKKTGLKNEQLVSELISKGSLAINTKNEFGVHVFSGSIDNDGIISGKLTKPKYNKEELEKSIDTTIIELLPITPPDLPDTVLRVIYNEALEQIEDLREQVRLLNVEVGDLTAKVTELEIVTQSLRIELDGKDLTVASVENQNRQSIEKVQSSIIDLQNSIQKATAEAIQRVSLSARNELLDKQIEVLNEQLAASQEQVANLNNTINSLNGQITNLVSQTNSAQSQAASAQQALLATARQKKKIICNELYNQGFLPQHIWDADERYGEMMWDVDRRLVIGYNIWAKGVVEFMKKNPKYTKYIYLLVKPWTEYMAYEVGTLKKSNWLGKVIHYVGKQYSYFVYDRYMGKRNKLVWH